LGETEAAIRNLFATAKRISPCIVFIDEMDSIACKRGWYNQLNIGDSTASNTKLFYGFLLGWDAGEGGNSVNERLLSTLLNEMDGVEGRQGVFVVGCTNRPDQIDDAILRPG
jgi:transitional endoplasmic reticulum ATPase